MGHLQEYYIQLLSAQLEGCKRNGSVFNFRCPICGDSRQKKKRRGYLYVKDNQWVFYCHNCTQGMQFKWFLKRLNPDLFHEYMMESLAEKPSEKKKVVKTTTKKDISPFKKLTKISSLRPDHPAKKLIVDRRIPNWMHKELLYCRKFRTFTNLLIPGKFEEVGSDEERIIIPIIKNSKIIGYQGRAIGPSVIRYITIVLDEDEAPLMWGLDRVKWNERHYICEGVFDACFIPNSLAACGSGLLKAVKRLNKPKNFSVLLFDNEPRNISNINQMRKAIHEGYRIAILPESFGAKDINERILQKTKGLDYVPPETIEALGKQIRDIIDDNVFYGLSAELKLIEWAKV